MLHCEGERRRARCLRHVKALQGNDSFLRIDLSESYMGDEGCKAICHVLQQSQIIVKDLNMRGSNIQSSGAAAIGHLLKTNKTIES